MVEWTFEQGEFLNCARQGGVEVTLDRETLQVEVEQGHGYMREHTTAYVPIEALLRLLEHAGFSVTHR